MHVLAYGKPIGLSEDQIAATASATADGIQPEPWAARFPAQ